MTSLTPRVYGIILTGPHPGLKYVVSPRKNRFPMGSEARLPYPGGIAMDVHLHNLRPVVGSVHVGLWGDPTSLKSYYGHIRQPELPLSFHVEDTSALGPAGAMRHIVSQNGLSDDDLVIIQYANTLSHVDLQAAVEAHIRGNAALTVMTTRVPPECARLYGMVLPQSLARHYQQVGSTSYEGLLGHFNRDVSAGGVFNVANFIEKPDVAATPSHFAFTGTAIASARVFKDLAFRDIKQLTYPGGLFQVLAASPNYTGRFLAYVWSGNWASLNSLAGYWYSLMDVLDGKYPGLYGGFPDGEEAYIHPSTAESLPKTGTPVELKPPYWIGENVTIGSGAVIGPRVRIEGGAAIGQGARLFENVYVDHGVLVGAETHIGPYVFLGSGWVTGEGSKIIGSGLLPPVHYYEREDHHRIVAPRICISRSLVTGGHVQSHLKNNVYFLDPSIGVDTVWGRVRNLRLPGRRSADRIYGAALAAGQISEMPQEFRDD